STVVWPSHGSVESSPAEKTEESDFVAPPLSYFTPVIKSSIEPSSEPFNSAEKTPIIEPIQLSSSLFASPTKQQPIRSSVLIRKPINSKYGYLISRNRMRVSKVKGTDTNPV